MARSSGINPCFRDIYQQEKLKTLEKIGTCTIGLCYEPGVVSFGVWVMCWEHALEYMALRLKWGVKK